jgi:hypothetical protein
MLKAKKLLLAICLINLIMGPTLAKAETWLDKANEGGLNAIGTEAYSESGAPQKSLQAIVASIIRVVLGFLGIIFVVLLIFGGFKYMTSGGNQDKVEEAIKMIKNAVIGLIIIAAAFSITYFITVKALPNVVK